MFIIQDNSLTDFVEIKKYEGEKTKLLIFANLLCWISTGR